MENNFLMSIGLMLCLSLSTCANNPPAKKEKPICDEWLLPDSAAYNKLGKRLATILFAPQKVKCYQLIGKEKVEESDIEIEQNFVRDTLLATLKSEEIAVLQYALLKPAKSYEKDSIMVMSPYMPILEFEFTKKKEKAHVVVSLSDMTWTVFYDDKKQFNYNYANKELFAQFCNFYLSHYNKNQK